MGASGSVFFSLHFSLSIYSELIHSDARHLHARDLKMRDAQVLKGRKVESNKNTKSYQKRKPTKPTGQSQFRRFVLRWWRSSRLTLDQRIISIRSFGRILSSVSYLFQIIYASSYYSRQVRGLCRSSKRYKKARKSSSSSSISNLASFSPHSTLTLQDAILFSPNRYRSSRIRCCFRLQRDLRI